jgi:hypothetical protein
VQSLHNPTRTNCLPEILPEFQRIFGESFRRFTKSALCWQFCWQLQLGSSQLIDTQVSKLEAEVGIEPTNEAFAEPCLTTWLPRRSNENNQLLLPCKNAFGKYGWTSKAPLEKSAPLQGSSV